MEKVLCDRCKREYETDDEDIYDRNFNKEKLCPDCKADSEI